MRNETQRQTNTQNGRHNFTYSFYRAHTSRSICSVSGPAEAGADFRRRIEFVKSTRAIYARRCCTVTVGDGVESFGKYASIQAAINALPDAGGEVCILPGRYFEHIFIEDRRDVILHGCGYQTRLASPRRLSSPRRHLQLPPLTRHPANPPQRLLQPPRPHQHPRHCPASSMPSSPLQIQRTFNYSTSPSKPTKTK